MRAGHDVEAVVGKRQTLAVPLHDMQPAVGGLATGRALAEHAVAQVYPPDMGFGIVFQNAGGEAPGPATDVQDPSVGCGQVGQQHAVGRLEEEDLQRVPVVMVAPAVEFTLGLGGAHVHSGG